MTLHGHLNAHSNEAVGMRKITACRLTPGNVNAMARLQSSLPCCENARLLRLTPVAIVVRSCCATGCNIASDCEPATKHVTVEQVLVTDRCVLETVSSRRRPFDAG